MMHQFFVFFLLMHLAIFWCHILWDICGEVTTTRIQEETTEKINEMTLLKGRLIYVKNSLPAYEIEFMKQTPCTFSSSTSNSKYWNIVKVLEITNWNSKIISSLKYHSRDFHYIYTLNPNSKLHTIPQTKTNVLRCMI